MRGLPSLLIACALLPSSRLASQQNDLPLGAPSFQQSLKRSDRAVFDPWGVEPTVTVATLSELCAHDL